MSDLLSSPLLQRVASAAQGAAQAVAAQAQNTVNQQWQQFEEEAAKTQQWREEQQQMQRKQDSRTAEVLLPARAVPARANRIKFSIDDDAVVEGMTPEEVAAADAMAPSPAVAASHAQPMMTADASGSTPQPSEQDPPWEMRLRVLLTLHEDSQAAVIGAEVPVMPRKELLLQLRALHTEMKTASLAVAHNSVAESTDRQAGGANGSALQQQAEALSVALAKSQLDARQKAEKQRRIIEALEARVAAAEAETIDRMRLVAESVQAETDALARVTVLEEELADVRSKAGARMKELIASNKALDDEIARLGEHDELNRSKISAMEASLSAADADHNRVARAAQSEATKQQQEFAYARALVLRFLELDSQREALFPAIAAAFRFTQQEVQRIQIAQEQHQQENTLWSLGTRLGSRLVGAAREVAEDARR
jgi:hypothetical protein|eukprot:jgi/Chrpa1/10049/Chrysochromulina_OHIO_Genome00021683-RA